MPKYKAYKNLSQNYFKNYIFSQPNSPNCNDIIDGNKDRDLRRDRCGKTDFSYEIINY